MSSIEAAMVNRNRFLHAMRRAASSVAVVTTDGSAGRSGITVSSVCPVSADPPSVLICVNQRSFALGLIRANGCFCVNLLSELQTHVADVFAGRVPEFEADRFACATWRNGPTGAPELMGAVVVLNCAIVSEQLVASHCVLIGEIANIESDQDAPLLYIDRGYCGVGAKIATKAAART
jgi:flavin reductase (DIM6/NTAB) family NADH-FMN oxidoreductase RutF